MSRNARIEEVSDSDSDPPEMDPSDFDPSQTLMRPADIPSTARAPPANTPSSASSLAAARAQQSQAQAAARERAKHYQALYPVYFDASRSRSDGRRVDKKLAVQNPLARTIIDALQALSIPAHQIVFEPTKMHPRDWANPGRVKVQLRRKEDGADMTGGRIRNKHELYKKVGEYLVQHPTTDDSPLRLRMAGVPGPKDGEEMVKPNVPRGWKVGTILPLHSPALSGGGVSEDFFKDMMKEMGSGGALEGNPMAQMANMMGGMGGGGAAGGGGGGQSKPKMLRVGKGRK